MFGLVFRPFLDYIASVDFGPIRLGSALRDCKCHSSTPYSQNIDKWLGVQFRTKSLALHLERKD